jgi:hypothetical protein
MSLWLGVVFYLGPLARYYSDCRGNWISSDFRWRFEPEVALGWATWAVAFVEFFNVAAVLKLVDDAHDFVRVVEFAIWRRSVGASLARGTKTAATRRHASRFKVARDVSLQLNP